MGRPRSSLLRSLRISGARRVGRRLPLEEVLTAAVTLGAVVLIREMEVWRVPSFKVRSQNEEQLGLGDTGLIPAS